MKILAAISEEEVYENWKRIDRFKTCRNAAIWRRRIWSPLPENIEWFEVEIERRDLEDMFIISSDEWSSFGPSSRLIDVARGFTKEDSTDIAKKIRELTEILQEDITCLDMTLFIVGPSLKGSFTLIDGNKRAVALYHIGRLVGNRAYLGISPDMVNYRWASRAHSTAGSNSVQQGQMERKTLWKYRARG